MRQLRLITPVVAGLLFYGSSALAQVGSGPAAKARATTPEIPYDAVIPYKMPPGLYMGEGIGVATNSKGHLFIHTRSGESRTFEFDAAGNFIKEFGKDSYGYGFAHSVRVDKDDNVWTVDEGPNIVQKFAPDGKLLMVLGKRPDAIDQLAMMPGTAPFSGANRPYSFHRPTDLGWDQFGNIFISDGYTDARIVKYDKNGRFIKSAGRRGNPANPLEFAAPHTMQVDEKGNVYVGDRGNSRIVVLDNDLNQKAVYDNVGAPMGAVHLSGTAPVSLQFQLCRDHHRFARGGPDRRHLQDGTGRHGARPLRPARRCPEGIRQHPHDGLPLTQHHLHRRNPGLARAESHAQAVAHETQETKEEHHENSSEVHCCGCRDRRRRPRLRPAGARDRFRRGRRLPVASQLRRGRRCRHQRGRTRLRLRAHRDAVATLGHERTFYHYGSKLFQFDQTGKFVKEIGNGTYALNFASAVRVDPSGQHLGGRRRLQPDHEVRAGWQLPAGVRTQARNHWSAPGSRSPREAHRRAGNGARGRWRRRRGNPDPAFRGSRSSDRPTWPSMRPATPTWPTASAASTIASRSSARTETS